MDMEMYALGRVRETHKEHNGPVWVNKKEEPTMKVSYNGITGKLTKLEFLGPLYGEDHYKISVYDSEKDATITFNSVKLDDVKFLGGEVTF